MYMICRFVHGSELVFFVIKPTATPLSTPTHVKMVSKFRWIKPRLFTGILLVVFFFKPVFVSRNRFNYAKSLFIWWLSICENRSPSSKTILMENINNWMLCTTIVGASLLLMLENIGDTDFFLSTNNLCNRIWNKWNNIEN